MIDHGEDDAENHDGLLTAIGRRAFTDRLGLDSAGVQYGPDGLWVDDQLRTTAQNIWGVGDVLGGKHTRYKYTHVAVEHGLIAAENAIRGAGRTMDYRAAPGAVFTDPELRSWVSPSARRWRPATPSRSDANGPSGSAGQGL